MKSFPPIPDVEDAPAALFSGGHLWVQEYLDGDQIRFQLRDSGRLRFGDDVRVWNDGPPLAFDHAVRHVREHLDREALRRAVDDVESVVFFGVAMHRRRVDYEWHRTPSFLGFAVWSDERERFFPPDVVERVYDRLGLVAVNAVAKEVRAADCSPAAYDDVDSAWRDGHAAGVVFLDKTGNRAKRLGPAYTAARVDEASSPPPSAAELAASVAETYLDDVVRALRADGVDVGFETVYDRTVDVATRAHHRTLFDGGVDVRQFRTALAPQVRSYLSARGET